VTQHRNMSEISDIGTHALFSAALSIFTKRKLRYSSVYQASFKVGDEKLFSIRKV
jgi:hypothetical protein